MTNLPGPGRCRIIPLPEHRTSFEIDGRERLCWNHGPSYASPFFYPLIGPGGHALTRIGHPGAPNHEHHRSIWFAHQNVGGHNFWEDGNGTLIQQRQWQCYQDGQTEAAMAVALDWLDGSNQRPLVEQELCVSLMPWDESETLVELQSTFRPTAAQVEFGQTNFGFLGVRVAKNLSVYFGDGVLSDSEGRTGEPAIFGRTARWVDYAGTAGTATHHRRCGITYFDHPDNSGYPNHWHVRSDGWMVASPCMRKPIITTRDTPLVVRYLLHAHAGPLQPETARDIAANFAARPRMQLARAPSPHVQFEIRRG